MIKVGYTASFLRQLDLLPEDLQNEAIEKIDLLRDRKNHQILKVHKLKGKLNDRYSFSVNYRTRIVFYFERSKDHAILHAIGDHKIYEA